MEPDDQRVADDAVVFAKANRKKIARRLTDQAVYLSEDAPVSVFMAGSPGAGKTEASLEFLARFGGKVLRIDPDTYRCELPGYTGRNSSLFQRAVSVLVSAVHDEALRLQQSFLLDGTSSNYETVSRNIQRSLKRGRFVLVLYVYQNPERAWEFVQAREKVEGRNIPVEGFVHQYFAAREVVNQLKYSFGHAVTVDIFVKNTDGSTRAYKENVERIDTHIPESYDRASLERRLNQMRCV
ncbi:MAG TPA: zeta toxin family protein [Pseudomonas sp.]|nr:zeta toxin family protein [Pseudomonas sp.]